jgi:hypothetical protein
MSDTVATWIKKGVVAEPFETPLLPGFRVNISMVNEEPTKI